MTHDQNHDSTISPAPEEGKERRRPRKHHVIRCAWVRIPLKLLLSLIIFILMIPVLIYLPPVQDALTGVACRMASDATGMKISIGRFRLKFPLDVALDDVLVIEARGDTMVKARTAIADVRLRPLLDMDIRLRGLRLIDGYYRMLSADSSMLMTVRAGQLDVDGRSSFALKDMALDLNKARLRDADVHLVMNVWKKKIEPDTAASTPFKLKAADLRLENVSFAMSMLPTIDTMRIAMKELRLEDGSIDLGTNEITARLLSGEEGGFTYLTPTPEWVKAHPAPVDTISPPSPPMTIRADSISLDNFDVVYGIAGTRPQPGFDANYISLTGVSLSLHDFYNQSSTVRVPISRLMARERCGLQVLSGSGLFRIDSIGLNLQDIDIRTPNTRLMATASIPFALMELKPNAPMSVQAEGTVGFADITAFMPSLRQYTSMLSPATSLLLNLDAAGTLASVDIRRLQADLPRIFSLDARGRVANALKPEKIQGNLDFRASLTSPAFAQKMLNMKDISIPSFDIDGKAEIAGQTYAADFTMRSSAGDVAADGCVSLTAESYTAVVDVNGLNVGHIMPSLGVGTVTASLEAHGAGFNPTRPGAASDIRLNIARADYGGHSYSGIAGTVGLHNGEFNVDLSSSDPDALLTLKGTGSVGPDKYTVDLTANVDRLDLHALGLSPEMSNGNGYIYVRGTLCPDRWLYDVELEAENVDWNMPDQYIHLPNGIYATFYAQEAETTAHVESDEVSLDFTSPTNLKALVDKFSQLPAVAQRQMKEKNLDIADMQKYLPDFALNLNASGGGILKQFLHPRGMAIDTIYANISNADSLLTGNIGALKLVTSSVTLDTMRLDLNQRGTLLDYHAHLGNTADNLPEFAQVDLNGYIGGNRASAFLRQQNAKGETGYRLGFTAAMQDSTATLHFTPLKATIAYLPWTFNLDNHVDYDFYTHRLDASLRAMSNESSILLETTTDADGGDAVHANLTNIKIQDFLPLIYGAPDVKATVTSDLNLKYRGRTFSGKGTMDVAGLEYNRQKIQDFSIGFDADYDMDGNTRANASLLVAGKSVMAAEGIIKADAESADPNDFTLKLTEFPLNMANAFLGKDVAQLEGALNGEMRMDGKFSAPILNGDISFDKGAVYIPMMGSRVKFASTPIDVVNNVVSFNDFNITGQNKNPLTVAGTVDVRDFANPLIDLKLDGTNFQLVNNDKRARSDIYGKLFLTLGANVSGNLQRLDINGNLTVLNTTDVFYTLSTSQNALMERQNSDVVKFVNFNDTTTTAAKDSVAPAMAMRIRAGLTITPGTQVTVNLSNNGTDKVQLTPSGTLNYFQNYMGDMRLNGQLMLGDGFARYSLPVVGDKMFTFNSGSFIQWNGPVMNPILSISATNNAKVNVSNDGNARLVNFLISLNVSNTLENPKILFDLAAEGDMTIQNELQSETPDQRSNQAMNMLISGQYTGQNVRTVSTSGGVMAENALYSFLSSRINSWAANNIRGVDLSFGVNQYEQGRSGENQQTTSYSYQVSKSLFNNRFKIVVGGNYSTDASADENFEQNLLSDVSFEYMLKQTNSLTMLVKLFRHNDYESVLEGEVSETGVGFVMKRRMDNLRRFFRVRWGKRKKAAAPDSVTTPVKNETKSKP